MVYARLWWARDFQCLRSIQIIANFFERQLLRLVYIAVLFGKRNNFENVLIFESNGFKIHLIAFKKRLFT